jgi:hypothetical protein
MYMNGAGTGMALILPVPSKTRLARPAALIALPAAMHTDLIQRICVLQTDLIVILRIML